MVPGRIVFLALLNSATLWLYSIASIVVAKDIGNRLELSPPNEADAMLLGLGEEEDAMLLGLGEEADAMLMGPSDDDGEVEGAMLLGPSNHDCEEADAMARRKTPR